MDETFIKITSEMHEQTIIRTYGDINCSIRKVEKDQVIGKYGEEVIKNNGDSLIKIRRRGKAEKKITDQLQEVNQYQ